MKKQTKILSLLLALLMVFSFSAFAAEALTIQSVTYNDADLEGATVPAGSEIKLVFSNNVTDETVFENNLGKIKVKDAEGKAATATPSKGDDNKTFIVTLGDLAKGDYTLEIGKEFAAKNGSTLGEKKVFRFKVKGTGAGDGTGGGNNPLTIDSITVDGNALEGAELKGGETIIIKFTRGMTENAAANAALIQVIKADGTAAEYTVISPENKDEKNDVKVQLGTLEGGSYTLVLGKDIKANNGNTLGEDVKVAFTVKAEEQKPATLFERVVAFFRDLFARIKAYITVLFSSVGPVIIKN